MSDEILFEVRGVALAFGGVRALTGVDFSMKRGELTALIGPNGAGKTSLLNCINGFYRPQTGSIRFLGRARYAAPTNTSHVAVLPSAK